MNKETKPRDYKKFFTPLYVATYMTQLLDPQEGDAVLEPSAGDGAIVRVVKKNQPGCIVFAFELNEEHKSSLKEAGANVVVIKDFLEIPVYAKFTSCIANPPFGNGIDLMAHFNHIRSHVKTGGRIVMLVPEDFDPLFHCFEKEINNWATNSDGTTTPIKIISFTN